jgi:dolichyl-diphosphooligosaccharide--protein glycosyltransferase
MGVRLLSWHSVFQRDGVYFNGNDAYYHARRIRYSIDHFPNVLDFDPLINFPAGAQPIWPPTFDWLIAAVLRLLPGIDQADQLEGFAVWIPPLVGAGTVLVVYVIGLRFFSRLVAVVAASSMAILPAHVFYSRLGALDHHFLIAGIVAVMLMLAMALFRDESTSIVDGDVDVDGDGDADGAGKKIGLSVGLGLSIAAAVLVWPGSLLHVGVLQVAMVIRLLTATDSEAARLWALRFSILHGVACLAVYPMSAGNEWALWGTLSPVVLSDFQPLYFFAAAVCFGFPGLMWRMGWGAETRLMRLISSGVLGAVLLVGMLLAISDLGAAITDALSWFAKDEEFQSVVNESVPLFGGSAGSARALAFLGGFVYVVPFSIAYFGLKFRDRAEVLVLIGWGSALFLATLVQWRFMNSFSIAYCLLIGITVESVIDALRSRWPALRGTRGAAPVVAVLTIGIVLLAFVAPVRSYRLHLENLGRDLRGEETIPVGTLLHTRLIADAARFLRDNSPPPEEAPSSVLGPWGDGHILKYFSERAIVQDNFGDDAAPENFERAEQYFSATSESAALELVSPMATRYVLVRSTGSGHSHGYAPASLFSRLYQLKGSRGQPPGLKGQYSPAADSLRQHRLIYQSAPLHEGDPKPYVMLFELVEGAKLVGHADPGALVKVSLVITPRTGRRFTYSDRVLANAAGEYTIRLPYPNEPFSSDVRSGDQYTLRVGKESVTVAVSESAVLDGAQIDAPAFGR